MKKISTLLGIAVAAVAMFILNNVNVQTAETAHDSKAIRLGVGLSLGVPTTERLDFAIGGDLRLQKDFSGVVSGLVSAGYTNFSLEGDDGVSFGFIPIKAGIKVFPKVKFYFSGELGAGIPVGINKTSSAAIFAGGLGYGFNNGVDIGLRYESFTMPGTIYEGINFNAELFNQVALRIAYGFRL